MCTHPKSVNNDAQTHTHSLTFQFNPIIATLHSFNWIYLFNTCVIMDLETDSSNVESVKDNIDQGVSSPKSLGNGIVESSFQENGSHVKQNHDEMIKKGTFSNSVTPKGHGLKKWRRIRRDVSKSGDSGIAKDKYLSPERSNPGERVKRAQVYAEKSPKSEGSASSTNAVVRNLDGFSFLADNAEVLRGALFAAGTDSENSEDRSSNLSTAASVPKVKPERPVLSGSLQGKTMSGKSLKGQTESTKKARGERVKIEKENSYSSMESDSRSSNFVFMQGNHSNGNGDVVYGSSHRDTNGVQSGYGGDGDRGYEDISHEAVVDESSWGVKEERDTDESFSMDQDPLVESALALQSVQEALEKEVLKFKEIGMDIEEKLHETRSEQLLFEVERELEDFFRQKIEAEVEHLVTSRTVQSFKTNINQLGLLKEQKAMASDQTQILKKIGDNEKHAVLLKTEAEKLETICEDIANADETLKLQNRVCKYTSCFLLQLVLLVVIVGIFIYQLPPPSSVQIVPT